MAGQARSQGGFEGFDRTPNPRLAHAQIGHCTRPPARGVMAGRKRSSDVPPTAKITKYFCSEDPSGSYNAVFDSSTETERPEESESAESAPSSESVANCYCYCYCYIVGCYNR